MRFTGSMPALITPFRSGKLDDSALRKLIDWQIACGSDGIVVAGTTGEAATLRREEHARLIALTKDCVSGRVAVIAGTGANSTEHAIVLARQAKEAGADAHLSVTPYYNKPTQEGLFQHFQAIAKAVNLPMILYNVPGRTAVNMLATTTARLAHIENIIGTKEACGDLDQIREVIESTPKEFIVLSGEDAQNVEIYTLGGKGCISVTANVAPDKVSAIWDAFASGEKKKAASLHESLTPLNSAMFFETNPLPAKTALSLMGYCAEEFRLPLVPMSPDAKERLRVVLKNFKLI